VYQELKMTMRSRLADFDHPLVQQKAAELASGNQPAMARLENIFLFVRDGIHFGFTPRWDEVRASEVLGYGVGYCNTKATLFRALCQAWGIPPRIQFGLIDIRVMRGILPSFSFPFMPKVGGHSWIEVQIDGQWKPIDSYINDREFYERALTRLHTRGGEIGYSMFLAKGKSSCELNYGEKGFVHMGAVVEDHGVWEDAAEYFASSSYRRLSAMQSLVYPVLARLANRNVERLRAGATG
jgi:Transglutaminase-like superfamily